MPSTSSLAQLKSRRDAFALQLEVKSAADIREQTKNTLSHLDKELRAYALIARNRKFWFRPNKQRKNILETLLGRSPKKGEIDLLFELLRNPNTKTQDVLNILDSFQERLKKQLMFIEPRGLFRASEMYSIIFFYQTALAKIHQLSLNALAHQVESVCDKNNRFEKQIAQLEENVKQKEELIKKIKFNAELNEKHLKASAESTRQGLEKQMLEMSNNRKKEIEEQVKIAVEKETAQKNLEIEELKQLVEKTMRSKEDLQLEKKELIEINTNNERSLREVMKTNSELQEQIEKMLPESYYQRYLKITEKEKATEHEYLKAKEVNEKASEVFRQNKLYQELLSQKEEQIIQLTEENYSLKQRLDKAINYVKKLASACIKFFNLLNHPDREKEENRHAFTVAEECVKLYPDDIKENVLNFFNHRINQLSSNFQGKKPKTRKVVLEEETKQVSSSNTSLNLPKNSS